jgi:hypothetical protein
MTDQGMDRNGRPVKVGSMIWLDTGDHRSNREVEVLEVQPNRVHCFLVLDRQEEYRVRQDQAINARPGWVMPVGRRNNGVDPPNHLTEAIRAFMRGERVAPLLIESHQIVFPSEGL